MRLRKELVSIAMLYVSDKLIAEDIVHDTYFHLLTRSDDELSKINSLEAYSKTTTRFKAIKYFNKYIKGKDSLPENVPTFIDPAIKDTLKNIDNCIEKNQKEEDQIIFKFLREGFDYKEIAARINKSYEHVKRRVFEIRKSLRNCLGDE